MERKRLDVPNERNVDLGDLVAFPNKNHLIKLFPIVSTGSRYIMARDNLFEERVIRYDSAIVIKKDGTVLVGESVYNPKIS